MVAVHAVNKNGFMGCHQAVVEKTGLEMVIRPRHKLLAVGQWYPFRQLFRLVGSTNRQ